jgi:hypothetical protein
LLRWDDAHRSRTDRRGSVGELAVRVVAPAVREAIDADPAPDLPIGVEYDALVVA